MIQEKRANGVNAEISSFFRRYSESKVYLLYCPPMQRATPLSGVCPLRQWVGGYNFRLPPRSDVTDVTLFSEGDLAAEAEKVKLKTSSPFDLFERTRIFNVPFLSYVQNEIVCASQPLL